MGLQLHPDKTKILHNGIGYVSCVTSTTINDMRIEVLSNDKSTAYLGRALRPTDMHDEELGSRLSKAWKRFGEYKKELTNAGISIKLRLKLFDTIITPTVLYGSASWAQSSQRGRRLCNTQKRMLRVVAGCHKHYPTGEISIEDHIKWLQDSNAYTSELMERYGVCDWGEAQLHRKWDWAGKVACRTDLRWTHLLAHWVPVAHRRRGRPETRWEDQINRFLTEVVGAKISQDEWMAYAARPKQWRAWKEQFVRYISSTEGNAQTPAP